VWEERNLKSGAVTLAISQTEKQERTEDHHHPGETPRRLLWALLWEKTFKKVHVKDKEGDQRTEL